MKKHEELTLNFIKAVLNDKCGISLNTFYALSDMGHNSGFSKEFDHQLAGIIHRMKKIETAKEWRTYLPE